MVTRIWRAGAKNYLRRHGVTRDAVANVLSGFDFHFPVYEQPIARGEIYFQFSRTGSIHQPPASGGWFCLRGQDMTQLAIHSPGAPRKLAEFEVIESIVVLEGTAKDLILTPARMRSNPELAQHGIGGLGGGTQIYVPPRLRAALRMRGMYLDSDRFANPTL